MLEKKEEVSENVTEVEVKESNEKDIIEKAEDNKKSQYSKQGYDNISNILFERFVNYNRLKEKNKEIKRIPNQFKISLSNKKETMGKKYRKNIVEKVRNNGRDEETMPLENSNFEQHTRRGHITKIRNHGKQNGGKYERFI